jgi:DNA modification methylase
LRRDIVWAKALSTEPTRADRPVMAHEFVFLFSKAPRYFYALPEQQESDVWRIASDGSHAGHFATMPCGLAARCIERGTKRGDMVLDPFAGAGTTALVADRLGRDATLIELNPEYAALARERITADAPLFADGAA